MKAKKHLGQHFLKDDSIINRILDAVEAEKGERFIEIGPGPATLTMPFNRRGFPFQVVEADADMVTYLKEQPWDPPVEVIHSDFLKVNLDNLVPTTTKFFSNLPYNVSVPITARLIKIHPRVPLMVMMYQKEVALRIRASAGSKDYGPISVTRALYYDVDFHFDVKPGSFQPPPKVMSQVIRLRRKDEPMLPLEELAEFEQMVGHVFMQRRKMLSSTVKKWRGGWIGAPDLLEALHQSGIDPKLRPERLEPADFLAWFRTAKGAI